VFEIMSSRIRTGTSVFEHDLMFLNNSSRAENKNINSSIVQKHELMFNEVIWSSRTETKVSKLQLAFVDILWGF